MAALSASELLALWRSVTDPAYAEPILADAESAAAIVQGLEQHARVSLSIERSTQALYLLPWSGQTEEPASGERHAVVMIEVRRMATSTVSAAVPLVLEVGHALVEHVARDYGPDGPVEVLTGRRYVAVERAVVGSGEEGPVLALYAAERPGPGYNLPPPGTLQRLAQPGAGLLNPASTATLVGSAGSNRLTLAIEPDVVTPAHVGQYLELVSLGPAYVEVRRVRSVSPAGTLDGGIVELDTDSVVRVTGVTGVFVEGETVTWSAGEGVVLAVLGDRLTLEVTSGETGLGAISGLMSGATATISQIERFSRVANSTQVSWRVLSWAELGLTVTNPASPSGGRIGVLDELGLGVMSPRAPSEPDDVYRERLAASDDVVAPNALLRAANRVLAPLGFSGCLRETGTEKLPGLYFDVDSADPALAFAFDLPDEPPHRWKLLLDYVEFRAFFLMGVPEFAALSVGAAYDVGGFDDAPSPTFFDGENTFEGDTYVAVWSALDRAHGGGVGFDLYVERDGCAS